MTRMNLLIALAALALLTACSVAQTDEPSTTATTEPSSTSSTSITPSSSTTQGVDRELSLVGCDEPPEDVSIVCEVYDLIQTHYVDDVEDEELAEAAAEGLRDLDGADSEGLLVCAMPTDDFAATCGVAAAAADTSDEAAEAMVNGFVVHALDPNSGYLDPEALALVEEEQQGQIEGIGALVSPEDQTIPGDDKQCAVISETCRILIVSTIEGSPAESAGLLRDDVLVGVDGESILGWTVDEVTATVRGPAGSEVTLTIQRAGDELDVRITRAAVTIPVIEQDTFGEIGYVRLRSFSGSAGDQFEQAIVDVLADGVSSLVIDLRDNPGGFLDTAIDVTSVFLADGEVVVTQGPENKINYEVNGASLVPEGMDVTIVVNKGSASASEVVSATLQERGRVTVVGENTFGKNTVQQRFNLSNGGAMRLTVARWLTPGGLDFGGGGVTPDVMLDVAGLTAEELVAAVSGL